MKRRLLDLFCCQGGASAGYAAAGFDVLGVDIEPQPRYPFQIAVRDVLGLDPDWIKHSFDAVHASPPCQAHTLAQRIQGNAHPDLIEPTRELLIATGLPYVIENVVGAPLIDPVELCGCMFHGLGVYRERLFETNWPLPQPEHREHAEPLVKMGRPPKPGHRMHVVGNFSGADVARTAMGMPWATRDGLREAIPPAYTEFIGRALLAHLSTSSVGCVHDWRYHASIGAWECFKCVTFTNEPPEAAA